MERSVKHFHVGVTVPTDAMDGHTHPSLGDRCLECRARTDSIRDRLVERSILAQLRTVPVSSCSREHLVRVHSEEYLNALQDACDAIGCNDDEYQLDDRLNRPDVFLSATSAQAAFEAAGAVVNLLKMVCENQLRRGFALVRPPGHHSKREGPEGFCLVNNLAVAAKAATEVYNLSKVMIVGK